VIWTANGRLKCQPGLADMWALGRSRNRRPAHIDTRLLASAASGFPARRKLGRLARRRRRIADRALGSKAVLRAAMGPVLDCDRERHCPIGATLSHINFFRHDASVNVNAR